MFTKETGVLAGSDLYLFAPSEMARSTLYHMTSCGHYFTNSQYQIRRNEYLSDLLLYVCDGQMAVKNGEHNTTVRAGELCIINSDIPHEYRTVGRAEFIWAHINGPELGALRDWIAQKTGSLVIAPKHPDQVKDLLLSFVYEMRSKQRHDEWNCSAKLYELLIGLAKETSPGNPDVSPSRSAAIAKAIRLIEEQFDKPLTLDVLSRAANMSKYHFSRRFKQECGASPHAYLTTIRMNKAMYLLKSTDLTIREISQMVGYPNEGNFSTAFHDRIGLSPARFRQYPI